VSPRRRIVLLVVLAAAAAVALVGAAVVSSDGSSATTAGTLEPRPGRPPLSFALGFRDDAEARDLERGAAAYR
jgi:hypothetical protein